MARSTSVESPFGTYMVTPSFGATGIPAAGSPIDKPIGAILIHFAAVRVFSSVTHNGQAFDTLLATNPVNCCPAHCLSLSATRFCCSELRVLGAFNFANSRFASAARASASLARAPASAIALSLASFYCVLRCSVRVTNWWLYRRNMMADTPPSDAEIAPTVISQNESASQNDTDDSSDILLIIALVTLFGGCLIALLRRQFDVRYCTNMPPVLPSIHRSDRPPPAGYLIPSPNPKR